MPAKWQQWMPLNLDQLWSSPAVQRMSPAAFKGYISLISAQWQSDDCTIPSDMNELSELSRLSDEDWEKASASILRKFDAVEDGRLRNDVCFAKWNEAKTVFEARQASARKVNARSPHDDRTVTDQSPTRSADTRTLTDTYTETRTEEPKELSEAKASSPRKDSGKPNPIAIEAIYREYPRKVGKEAALKAISRAVDRLRSDHGGTHEAQVYLFRRVQSYARSPAGNCGELTPHPATWFNQGRYNDDPKEWQRKANERGTSYGNSNQGRGGITGDEMSRILDSLGGSETGDPVRGDEGALFSPA